MVPYWVGGLKLVLGPGFGADPRAQGSGLRAQQVKSPLSDLPPSIFEPVFEDHWSA